MLITRAFLSAGEESLNMETCVKPVLLPSNEKIQFGDRLAISITKRKRSTPQKFLGEFLNITVLHKVDTQIKNTNLFFIIVLVNSINNILFSTIRM